MRIVLCYPIQQPHFEQIQAAVPQAEVVDAGQERIAAEILKADVALKTSGGHEAAVLEALVCRLAAPVATGRAG